MSRKILELYLKSSFNDFLGVTLHDPDLLQVRRILNSYPGIFETRGCIFKECVFSVQLRHFRVRILNRKSLRGQSPRCFASGSCFKRCLRPVAIHVVGVNDSGVWGF